MKFLDDKHFTCTSSDGNYEHQVEICFCSEIDRLEWRIFLSFAPLIMSGDVFTEYTLWRKLLGKYCVLIDFVWFFSPVRLLIVIWHTYLWSPCVQDKIWHSLSINHLLLLYVLVVFYFLCLSLFSLQFFFMFSFFFFACISLSYRYESSLANF